ncbi:MAG: hypothetical protein RRZ84_03485 [Romboutsia sp.]
MKIPKKIISFCLALGMVISATSTAITSYADMNNNKEIYVNMSNTTKSDAVTNIKMPKQVNIHMGGDASTQVNLSYTTIDSGLETKVVLNKVGDSNKITVNGENSKGNTDKYFHKIAIKK